MMSDISTADEAKITLDEIRQLFGDSMPMEGVTILQTASSPDDARAQLKALTTRLAPDRTERAREAAEAWRIPANSDGTGELVKPRDHCVWGFEQGYLAALTPATAPDREAVARIIDPGAWRARERHLDRVKHWEGRPEVAGSEVLAVAYRTDADTVIKPSLTKADAILSLMGEG